MQPLQFPPRLLMGPGPINCYPSVLQAMSTQLVGQYDPTMTGYMNEVMALYRQVFNTQNEQTFLIDGTSRAGIEASLVSVLEPGDKVLVPIFGRFGHLLTEIAERADAEVHTIEVPWGEVFDPQQIEEAIKRVQPKVLAIVQGDTSTTMLQPLNDIGGICRAHDVLLYTDATASIGYGCLANRRGISWSAKMPWRPLWQCASQLQRPFRCCSAQAPPCGSRYS